jgi:integrase
LSRNSDNGFDTRFDTIQPSTKTVPTSIDRTSTVRKPHRDFPLFPHATGRWAKKVRGKFVYFGKVADDPQGSAALALWLEQRDDLLAGRTPRSSRDELTIRDLCNRYLSVKQHQVETREISRRHFDAVYTACELLIEHFGRSRSVSDLTTEDFESLRASLARTRASWALGSVIAKIRTMFKYAYEARLIDRPMRYGPTFKRPGKSALRRERANKPRRLFTEAELRKIIDTARGQLKAMILLGINGGMGNADCGQLRLSNLNLSGGWLDFPRPKTGVGRRFPLWPETVEAIKESLTDRPDPKEAADRDLVFVTKYGRAWYQDKDGASAVGHEFRKLLSELKILREGLSFYTLRHTFATEAGAVRDEVALGSVMGHADSSMAEHYRERIDDARLKAVTDHIHAWLWPKALRRKAK